MTHFLQNPETPISRRRALGGLGAAGALATTTLLVGCGGDDGGTTPTAATGTATAPVARSLPNEFVVANEVEPDDLFPYFASYGSALVTRQVYETLVEPRMTLTPSGAVEITLVGALAESWQQIEPTRWRFKLRPGVTFHNGEPWDAEAAKASYDVMADSKLALSLKKSSYLARAAKSCEIVDPMTIDIVTPAPDNEFPNISIRIGFSALPPKLLKEKGLEAFREAPVGTGPYAFKSWTRGQDIKLEKFAGHWRKDGANMKSVRYIVRKDASIRAQTVKTGEAHFAYNIGAEQAQALQKSVVGGGFQSSGIRFNNSIAPTNDIRVRRALNLAIDRKGIVKSIFRGSADPIAFFAYQPVKLTPFDYKPDEARKLIEQAGVKGQTLEFVYGEGRIPEEDQLAEVYKAAFDAIGLKIKLTRLEPKQYNELGGKPFPEQPPLYLETTSSGNFGDIASGLKDKYGCKGSGTFCNSELDKEFDALAALPQELKVARLQAIAERLTTVEVSRAWVAGVRQVHGIADVVSPSLPLNAYILFDDLKFA